MWWSPNDDEIALIKHTWPTDLDEQEAVGRDVLHYILDHSKQHKLMFPELVKAGKKWAQCAAFYRQATKFNETIDFCVQNLTRPRKIERHLFDIGGAHCRLLPIGFKVNINGLQLSCIVYQRYTLGIKFVNKYFEKDTTRLQP